MKEEIYKAMERAIERLRSMSKEELKASLDDFNKRTEERRKNPPPPMKLTCPIHASREEAVAAMRAEGQHGLADMVEAEPELWSKND